MPPCSVRFEEPPERRRNGSHSEGKVIGSSCALFAVGVAHCGYIIKALATFLSGFPKRSRPTLLGPWGVELWGVACKRAFFGALRLQPSANVYLRVSRQQHRIDTPPR